MAVSFQRPDRLKQIATAFRVNEDALQRGEPKMLSNAQRAGQLGAAISQLTTPFELSPAVPKAKAAHLELYSACLFPQSPGATGSALLNSTLQPELSSIASISFRRLKKGQKYLVEFHVQL